MITGSRRQRTRTATYGTARTQFESFGTLGSYASTSYPHPPGLPPQPFPPAMPDPRTVRLTEPGVQGRSYGTSQNSYSEDSSVNQLPAIGGEPAWAQRPVPPGRYGMPYNYGSPYPNTGPQMYPAYASPYNPGYNPGMYPMAQQTPYIPLDLKTERPGKTHPVWAYYMQEAAIEDKETVEAWKNDLDTLLVFAGLFSAILTAFLIESYHGLQPDSSDRLYNAITDGFRSLSNTAAPPASSETWSATSRSVRVNGLWFASLACSLLAAAGAMIAKSWCQEYLRSFTAGSPYDQAQRRQRRFDNLQKWWFREVVDCIPWLLYAAFILFGIGLCDFLLELRSTIAYTIIAIFGLGLLFGAATTTAAIFNPDCPYRTPLSSDLARAYKAVLHPFQNLLSRARSSWETSREDEQAARDQAQLSSPRKIPLRRHITVVLWSIYNALAKPVSYTLSAIQPARNSLGLNENAYKHHAACQRSLKKRRQNEDVAAWGWLIKSSANEALIAEILQSIPALILRDEEREILKASGAVDRLVAFFVTTFDSDHALGQPTPITIPPAYGTYASPPFAAPQNFVAQNQATALLEFARALRVLYGPPTGRRNQTLDPVSKQLLRLLFALRDQKNLEHRVVPESFCLLDGFGELGGLKWQTIEEVADEGTADWGRLLLMETIGDAVRVRNCGRDEIALPDGKVLSSVCKLMATVSMTSPNCLSFLRTLFIVLSTNTITEPIDPTQSIHYMINECVSIFSNSYPESPAIPRHYNISLFEYQNAQRQLLRIITWYFENRTDAPDADQLEQATSFLSSMMHATDLDWRDRHQAATTLWLVVGKGPTSRHDWAETILKFCGQQINLQDQERYKATNTIAVVNNVLSSFSPPEKWQRLLAVEEDIAPALVKCLRSGLGSSRPLHSSLSDLLSQLQTAKVINPWFGVESDPAIYRPFKELETGAEMLLRWGLEDAMQAIALDTEVYSSRSGRLRATDTLLRLVHHMACFSSLSKRLLANEQLVNWLVKMGEDQAAGRNLLQTLALVHILLWYRAMELPANDESQILKHRVDHLLKDFPKLSTLVFFKVRSPHPNSICHKHLRLPFLKYISGIYPDQMRDSGVIEDMEQELEGTTFTNLTYPTGTFGDDAGETLVEFSVPGLVEDLRRIIDVIGRRIPRSDSPEEMSDSN